MSTPEKHNARQFDLAGVDAFNLAGEVQAAPQPAKHEAEQFPLTIPAPAPSYHDKARAMHKAGDRAWLPVTQAFYWDMLNVLPPIYAGPWWAVSEPWKHEAGNAVYLWFSERRTSEARAWQCRMATVPEIVAELKSRRPGQDVKVLL